MTKEEVAGIIDHTVLNAYASRKDVEKVCMEAKKCNFASVCINPLHVPYAAGLLAERIPPEAFTPISGPTVFRISST